jgi:ribose transport system substrate-binding protein
MGKRIYQSIAALAVPLSVALVATGCSANQASGNTAAGGKKPLTLALVVGSSSDPFFQAMKVGANAEAKAEGNITINYQGNANTYSPATQIPVLNQVLAQRPDGLALAPTDPVALQASVTRAVSQGVPVVNVDSKVNDLSKVLSFITGDNKDGGAKAADALATALNYQSGKTYEVAVGLTSATATTNTDRLAGFKSQIAAKYPGLKIVATGYSQANPATANTNINNWLTAYPNLAGIFAIDGTNAQGAAAALRAKGIVGKVKLIGYDAYKTNVDLLKQGVFTALISQTPEEQGRRAVQTLVKYLRNGNSKTGIEPNVTLPNIILDKTTSAADLQKYTYVESAG